VSRADRKAKREARRAARRRPAPHWHIHVKTTDGQFYMMKEPFDSLAKAKYAAKGYEGSNRPPWLAELRIYRVAAGERCAECEERN